MENTRLTRDLIEKPSLVSLYMRLGAAALDVMLYNPLEEHSMIMRSFTLPDDGTERLKELENTVYDNPLLLCDFRKTSLLVESREFMAVPDEMNGIDQRRLILAAHPGIDPDFGVTTDMLSPLGATLLTAVPDTTLNFLRRTFNNAPVINPLSVLCRYFRSRMTGGSGVKMLVNMRQGSLDIIALSRDRLSLVNRFEFSDHADAVYYVLACAANINPAPEEILLAGDRTAREAVTPGLRRFHPYVMPMIYPSEMYRAGDTAMSAPFDLVIMPLCE